MMMQRFRKGWLLAIGLTVSLVAQAQDGETASKPSFYTYLGLILALLALIGLVLLWWQNRLAWDKINSERRSATGNSDGVRELSGRVMSLERDNKALIVKLKALDEQVIQLRQLVRSDNRQVATAVPPTPAVEPRQAPVQQPVRPSEPAQKSPVVSAQSQRPAPVNTPPVKLYARTADVPGGFSVSSLVETPNRPMVFVITPTGPTQATFRVTDDPEAQRLALSDPYSYLSDACNYQSRPEINSRIHVISDGKLQLQGEKWHIVEKAEISFYV
ncbi:hypothetical protein [Spirosoma endbachense]|uniref:Uncharacterized protein n=1 Tax=Spirosoma endbachense TaxID=2666025 RepID=A0A6P1VVI4_9BACT|nr:hypothetical protein [Spirosoma endbachense]QHV95767.1 hypothetical protein GJR95_12440 [Spirosoma endbachense]